MDTFSIGTTQILNLVAGTYSEIISDSNGCEVLIEYTINEPEEIEISQSLSNYNGFGVSCNGASDGFIDPVVSGQFHHFLIHGKALTVSHPTILLLMI